MLSRCVKRESKESREGCEILIGSEHGNPAARRDGANQEISVRTLDAVLPASVETTRRFYIIVFFQRDIWKCIQRLAKLLELFCAAHTGQELLPDSPNHQHSTFTNQFNQLPQFRRGSYGVAAQCERPH